MHHHRAIASCIALLLLGCTRSEPSLLPLGYGPLARAQRQSKAAERLDSATKAPAPDAHASAAERRSKQEHVATQPLPPPSRTAEAEDAAAVPELATVPSSATSVGHAAASNDSPLKLEDWVGIYRGNDVTTFKTTGQADRRFDDPKAKIRIEKNRKNTIHLVLIDSSNDQDMCTLSAEVEGDTATVTAGQSCFLESDDEVTAKSRPGKAVRSDKRLTLDLVLDTLMMSDEEPVSGSIEYHFDGQR